MSKTNLKRYLMLLGTIGLVAIAAGGSSGTFASFNAEVTNSGNSFATGTLVLNDSGGTNTCTSAGAVSNNNNSNNGCDTFFSLPKLALPGATLTSTVTGGLTTTLAFSGGLQNAAIDAGDSITITGGGNTETVVAATGADVGATSVTIVNPPTHTYASGTITDTSGTYYADLTLTDAGSLNASDIEFKMSTCQDAAQEGTTTLNGALSLNSVITSLTVNAVSGTFASGDPIVVTDGGTHTQTFIANGAVANGATTINIQSAKVNFAYANAAAVSGPSFGSGSVCGALKLSLVETDSSFHNTAANNAQGCAYGVTDPNNSTDGLGCTLANGTALSGFSGSFTPLNLFSGGGTGNTGTQLSASGSRYFLVAVKLPSGTGLDNTFQNRKAGFDLTWHIDQA